MKFVIEIYATAKDNDDLEPLHRAEASTITPLGARKEARRLLSLWGRRGAKRARVLNAQGQAIYTLAVTSDADQTGRQILEDP